MALTRNELVLIREHLRTIPAITRPRKPRTRDETALKNIEAYKRECAEIAALINAIEREIRDISIAEAPKKGA